MPHTDLALARRLERTEARGNAAFVEARARLDPSSGATWRDVAGTWAMYDGVGSPLTQTFGLGVCGPAGAAELEVIEGFFAERGADVFHEVSPLGDPGVLAVLGSRGYLPCEQSTVLHQPLTGRRTVAAAAPAPADAARFDIQPITALQAPSWAETAGLGWSDTPELAAFVRAFGEVSARSEGCVCFLVRLGMEPIASGALVMHDGVALLAGASTRPAFRRRGVQRALLEHRLAFAGASGCDLAMMVAAPGSTSQLNAERAGFCVAYTRTKWHRPHAR